ncbi:helix-turn-helix domain-containing protein [Actinopolymorpha sp. B11F2]|uniref:helix-turn-helix domain-containing protein n=1 Tax=Actinopolymorpha sp. B11F2 TaxID=3160862 RepID=UPI0032E529E1
MTSVLRSRGASPSDADVFAANVSAALAQLASGQRRVDDAPEPRFYSVAEVARMFGTCDATIRRAIYAGEFPAVKIRGRYIVPAKALDEMVDAAVASRALVDPADWVASGGVAG